jgi:hypothetical protein
MTRGTPVRFGFGLALLVAPLLVGANDGCHPEVPVVSPDGGAASACGGLAGLACAEGQYCDYAPEALCGAADQTGTCKRRPEVCTEQYDPVCGCDDKTYGNACKAASAGVSVVSKGECAPQKTACGTRGGIDCAGAEYCAFGPDCGATDKGGVCTPKPQICTKEWAPVCGCDGRTYGNACMAAAAGVSVASKGECSTLGKACGGETLTPQNCSEGEYCRYELKDICGAADAQGICTRRPTVCTREFMPVCGCDGKTYPNACNAAAAGTSVSALGACR